MALHECNFKWENAHRTCSTQRMQRVAFACRCATLPQVFSAAAKHDAFGWSALGQNSVLTN
jgi:hypothetical protein